MLTDIFQPEWYHEKYNINDIHPSSTDGIEVARIQKVFTSRIITRFLKDPLESMNNGIDLYLESDAGVPYDTTKSQIIMTRMGSEPVPLTESEIWDSVAKKKTLILYVPVKGTSLSKDKARTLDMYVNLSGLDVSSRMFISNVASTSISVNSNSAIPNHRALPEIKSGIDYMKYVRQHIINRHTKKWILATFISSCKVWLLDPSEQSQKNAGFSISAGRCLQNNSTSLDILNALTVYHKNVIDSALEKIMRPKDIVNKETFNVDLISGSSTTIANMLDMIDSSPSMQSTLTRNGNNPHYSLKHRFG